MFDVPVEIGAALILAVQAIAVAWIGRVAKHVRVIEGEVKNSHTTNLREEQDVRYAEQMGAFAHINSQLSQINQRDIQKTQDIQTINQKLGTVETTVNEHISWSAHYVRENEDRMGTLENTLDPRKDPS